MKLRSVKEIEVTDGQIDINFDIKRQALTMSLQYTCPSCSGWGCGKHGGPKENQNCIGGTVFIKLDPSSLEENLEGEDFLKIKTAIQNLYLQVSGK